MWYCEAYQINKLNICKFSHYLSTSHFMKYMDFTINNSLFNEKYVFDDPDVKQLDRTVDETSNDAIQ